MQGYILLTQDEVIEDEDSHDRNLLFDWDFSQTRVVNGNVIIDSGKKEISHDITNQKDHVFNQRKLTECRKVRKLWDRFLDN